MNTTLPRTLCWLAALATLIALAFWAAVAPAAMSDCMDATCRITAPDGSRGTGCVFEISQGTVHVLTAAHVVGNHPAVRCEFWRAGHQSRPLAAQVTGRSDAADAALVALPQNAFGGVLPKAIPLAPRDYRPRLGEALTSVGCANGAWSTGWKGHALGCDAAELRFVPTPANGRSGSAIFDSEGRFIVALLHARTADNAEGIATPVQAIYRAFDERRTGILPVPENTTTGKMPVLQQTQCGPNGCRPQTWQNHLLPYRYRHEQQGTPENQSPRPAAPWPTLPETAPSKPQVDVSPLDEKLGRIAGMLEDLKKGSATGPAPAPHDTGKMPVLQDEQARKTAEAAISEVAGLRADSEKNFREVRAETAKAHEAVGGLTTVVEKIKDSISEDGTLSQRFHARVDKVRTELDEKLGREATDREVRIGYVKDLFQEKVADGGLVGLAKALGLPIGLVLVVWLVTRDVKHRRETGDPLMVEKLAGLVESRFGSLQQRFEALRDKLHGSVAGPSEPPKTGS